MVIFLKKQHIYKYNVFKVEGVGGQRTCKNMTSKNKLDYTKDVLVALFGGYTITFLGIVIVAILLLFFQISENMVDMGILAIYVLACLTAGLIIGKRTKSRKFLWGMLSGGIYFVILFLISFLVQSSAENIGNDLVTVLLMCVGSGTLGGMIS